jgi:hypothetical protein
MASSVYNNLGNLKARRKGQIVSNSQLDEALASIYVGTEAFERRSKHVASQYALGAMQEVDPQYTKVSYVEGDRIKSQLNSRLDPSYYATFDYQGSVPMNVHIRGVSDIDLLVLRNDFLTVDPTGPGAYRDLGGDTPAVCLAKLRKDAAYHISQAFPEVDIDESGAKCITLSGGSLRRNIDVIPSHWHDTRDYQITKLKKDRGIKILNSRENVTILNLPFLHIDKVHNKDLASSGGAKKAIRLLKNISADSGLPDAKKLSSYDVASLVWHFPDHELGVPVWNELALVGVTQHNIERILSDQSVATSLRTPDNSRAILDTPAKVRCLGLLLAELTELSQKIAEELGTVTYGQKERIFNALKDSVVPAI